MLSKPFKNSKRMYVEIVANMVIKVGIVPTNKTKGQTIFKFKEIVGIVANLGLGTGTVQQVARKKTEKEASSKERQAIAMYCGYGR